MSRRPAHRASRTSRLSSLALLALSGLLASTAFGATGFSDATFTSRSTTTATVNAAADWTPPSVSVTSPGTPVQGTVTVNATATDAQSAITSVVIQYLAPGASTWTTLCTDTVAPYSCSWNTAAGADGIYDLRAIGYNAANYSTTSDEVRTTVANNVLVVVNDPGDVVRGTVSVSTSVYNGGLLPWLVTVQYATSGQTNWKTLCSGLSAPFTCSWNTTGFTDGSYDLRAVATSGTTSATSAIVSDILVDNTAPGVTMTNPGTPLRGTLTFGATATDDGSGVNQVVLQYQRAGGAWTNLCTIATDPWTCRYDTTTLADGTYAFRALATDVAGNTGTSASVTNRVIDNTVASVSVDDPGAYLNDTVTISAQASSSAGIASVRIQRAPAGTTTWTDLCTDTTAPWSCSWDTTTVADGLHDLRAILTDTRGVTTISATVSSRRVDNSPLRAVDVQASNGSGSAGRVDTGDTMTFTYSRTVNLSSITSGWTGTALPVTVRLRDGNLLGLGNKGDTVDVLRNNNPVALGSVNLREDYIRSKRTLTWNATLTATTVVVDEVERTVVTLQIGTKVNGSGPRTVSVPVAMVWTPSASALSLAGDACATAPVTEPGTADRDF